jgi:hypothetical protein
VTAVPSAAGAVTPEQVQVAAQFAALPLTAQEVDAVAELLGQWLPAAIALSARMQAADFDALTPITAFAPRETAQEGDRR